jgi:hypothetical protein
VSRFGQQGGWVPNEIALERRLLGGLRMKKRTVSKRRLRRARPLLAAAAGALLLTAGCEAMGSQVQPPHDLSAPDSAPQPMDLGLIVRD